ncbi:MAG: hypothetical protein IKT58_06690 [Oscillospiraceae bacterium]|nr:hypothetical protein [Oscillospiraceae bacterium]
MKKKFIYLLLPALLLTLLLPMSKPKAVAAAQDPASDIRIMSANVMAEFASWQSNGVAPESTSTRVVKLEKMLNENNPMLVGTQEMSPTWYTAFSKLDSTKWGWLEESDVAGYSYYNYVPNKGKALNSILYRKDLLTLYTHGVEAYTSRSNGQCIVWAVFTVTSTGKQFAFISTHWTPGADKANERLAQAEQLADKVNSLRQTYGDTVIVTGDFNCNDETQEYRRFLVNSGSLDSRTNATTRGDSLLKIDHITATGGASFTYHTVCYEANNAYAISDHPFIVADVTLDTAMMFDFTDNADSRAHYKQLAYRYNAYDYHTAYWRHDSALVSGLSINKTEGMLNFNISSTGNPYVIPSTTDSLDPKSTYGLSYELATAEVAKISFRLTGCELIDSSKKPSVALSVSNRSKGAWATDRVSYTLSNATSSYLTVTVPLTDSGVRSIDRLDSLKLTFENIKNGSVKIGYIYIGKNNALPVNSSLFFDYSGTSKDKSRYSGSSYGGYNFDTASKGYWASLETSTTSDKVYSDYSIDNSAGTLSLTVAQGLSYNNTNNKYGPWLTTTTTYGTYPPRNDGTTHPLKYNPKNADVVQIRFKTENCVLATGSNAQVVVVYDYDTGNGTARGDYTMIGDYTVSNGTYQILTIPVSQQFKSAAKITTFGFRFWHIKGSNSSAKVVIDYIYVGPEEGVPSQHVYTHKTTQSTCTAEGYTTHTCSRCKYSYKDSYTAPKGHSYDQGAVTTPATCTTVGLKTYTCTVCHGTKTEELPMIGHSPVTDEGFSPTCTESGLTEGRHCSNCSEVLSAQQILPPTGHTEVILEGTPPTCTNSGLSEGKYCSVCQEVLTAQQILPRTGHSYCYTELDSLTHQVTCENCNYSKTANHNYDAGLCLCGAEEAKEPVEDLSLKLSHSLNLASDISVNLVVPKTMLADFDLSTVYVESTYDIYTGNTKTGTTTVTLLPVENGYYYYFTLNGLTAVQMNNRICSVLYGTKNGQPCYSPVDDYAIADYAYAQLNKTNTTDSLRTLCADLLRYGAKAQIYKNYRTDALVDSAMLPEHMAYLSDIDALTFGNVNEDLKDLDNAPIAWAGKSLNLESKVCLKFVFKTTGYTGELSDLSLRVSYEDRNNETKIVTLTKTEVYNEAAQLYSFTVDSLLAAELRSVVSVQIYAGDTSVSTTLRYSPDTYGNGKTGALLELCKALFSYSDAAKAYFSN